MGCFIWLPKADEQRHGLRGESVSENSGQPLVELSTPETLFFPPLLPVTLHS